MHIYDDDSLIGVLAMGRERDRNCLLRTSHSREYDVCVFALSKLSLLLRNIYTLLCSTPHHHVLHSHNHPCCCELDINDHSNWFPKKQT